jgi:hypothetical protein
MPPDEVGRLELLRLRRAGGQVVRTNLLWSRVQPTPLSPYDWSDYDALVARAARERISILPVLIGSPRFAAPRNASPPTTPATKLAFAVFAGAAVERYGRDGDFWEAHPRLPYRPMTAWEVWNEPNIGPFWTEASPNPREYADLLELIHGAIKEAEPSAMVVLAGMPERREGNAIPVTRYLARLYRVPGARSLFDAAAAHPYAKTVARVERKLDRLRAVMRRNGDGRKPLFITELGWASDGPPGNPLVKDPATQARLVREMLAALRERRDRYRLDTVTWFRWRDDPEACPNQPTCWGENAGLFTAGGAPKPAWEAFMDAVGGGAGNGRPSPLAAALSIPVLGELAAELLDRRPAR